MKRFITAIAAIIMMAGTTMAQSNYAKFNKGDIAINVDYGLGAFNKIDGYDFDDAILSHSIGVSGEYGIMDGMINGKASIGVGGQFGLGFGREKYDGPGFENKTIATRIRIATRGVFHYQFAPQFDTYGGMTFCFVDIDNYTFKSKTEGSEIKADHTDTNFIEPRLFAGARYMVSDSFGVNIETTWDRFAFVAFGVTFKL